MLLVAVNPLNPFSLPNIIAMQLHQMVLAYTVDTRNRWPGMLRFELKM